MGLSLVSLGKRGSSFLLISFALAALFVGCLPLVLHKQLGDKEVKITSRFGDKLSGFASHVFQSDSKAGTDKKLNGVKLKIQDQENRLGGLDCKRWGGPANNAAEEMVYWEDIPFDSQFISPFHRRDGPTQYFTFEADYAGWNNVRYVQSNVVR